MARATAEAVAPAVRSHHDGCTIAVRVQPRARRTELAGLHGSALRVRLTAPPVDGRANEALLTFLADLLQVGPSAVRLVHGTRGRAKVLVVAGMAPDEACRRLAAAMAEGA